MKKQPSLYFQKEAVFFCVEAFSQENMSTVWELPLLVINKLKIFEEQRTLFCNNRHIIPIVFTGIDKIDAKIFVKLRKSDNCKTIAQDLREKRDPATLWVFAPFKTSRSLFEEFISQNVCTYMIQDVLPEDNPKKCRVFFTYPFPHFEVLQKNLLRVN